MKRLSLAVLVVAVGVAACSEAVMAPQATVDPSVKFAVSNPPPPDVDTGAVGAGGGTTFTLQVRYFFNKVGNAGWIKFDSELGDVSVDKNAQIRYSNGVFSGKGIVSVAGQTIDLALVSQDSQFSSCEAWSAPTGTDVLPDAAPVGCFNLIIGSIGNPDEFFLTEGCPTSPDAFDPRAVCRRSSTGDAS